MTKAELEFEFEKLLAKVSALEKDNSEMHVKSKEDKELADVCRNREFTVRKELAEVNRKLENLQINEAKLKEALVTHEQLTKDYADLKAKHEKAVVDLQNMNRSQIDGLTKDNEEKTKVIKNLQVELNNLAHIFDEYVKAHRDYMKVQEGSLAHMQYVENILNQKINLFNQGDK